MGHRIIEINNQSVVAVPHEKIVNLLATSVGEVRQLLFFINWLVINAKISNKTTLASRQQGQEQCPVMLQGLHIQLF